MADPIDWGSLRRTTPVDAGFGGGRGKPVDRHYIESFLAGHAADVRGRVLEVADDRYTRAYGGDRVTHGDRLHADRDNAWATVVGDLGDPASLPEGRYDCFICTQTLQYVYDLHRAVQSLHRLLAPGGVLLLTVPGITQASPYDRDRWGEYWRFTPQSVERLLHEAFAAADVSVRGHGNVLAATAFLQGLAVEDLAAAELDVRDDRYDVIVAARAVRRA